MKTAAKTILFFLTAVVSALSLSIALQSALAAWTNPIASPPASNLDAPLNEGSVNQAKLGGLSLGGNFSASAIQSANGGFIVTDSSDNNNVRAELRASYPNKNGLLYLYDNNENIDIQMHTNGAVFFNNNGNVGIGTTTPDKKLDVYNGGIRLISDGTSWKWETISNENYSDDKNSQLTLIRGRGTPSSPSYILSGDKIGEVSFRNHTNFNGSAVVAYATEDHSTTAAGSDLRFATIQNGSTGFSTKMLITNNGNVGIGTNSPNKQLHIKTASGNAEIDLQSGAKPYWGIYHDEASEDLRFWNTDNILTLTKTGNIGIGTITPTAKLEVVGGAIKAAGGLIVETRTSDPVSPATGQIWLRTDL